MRRTAYSGGGRLYSGGGSAYHGPFPNPSVRYARVYLRDDQEVVRSSFLDTPDASLLKLGWRVGYKVVVRIRSTASQP